MKHDGFAVFILTHGRADNVVTYKTLKRLGYTGQIYLLIDDEDNQEEKYRKKFKDEVVQFGKADISTRIDSGDLSEDRRVILYARNACFEKAEELGLKYFLELDDDYSSFQIRIPHDGKLLIKEITNLDRLFDDMLDFMDNTDALTVAIAQGGDFIGGLESGNYKKGILRKAMNTFFCKTEKKFQFVGRINEDVNTYTTLGQRGEKIFTFAGCQIVQKQTQKNKGGMSDVYLDMGTYLKSFFSVMYSPSCVKIATMGDNHKRIHHKVNWENCCPKIISEKYKK